MPFTRISLKKGTSPEYRRALMEQVYLAMRETIAIPENDRFATVTELEADNINNSGDYAGIDRSGDVVFIQITLKCRSNDREEKGPLRRDRKTAQGGPRCSAGGCRHQPSRSGEGRLVAW